MVSQHFLFPSLFALFLALRPVQATAFVGCTPYSTAQGVTASSTQTPSGSGSTGLANCISSCQTNDPTAPYSIYSDGVSSGVNSNYPSGVSKSCICTSQALSVSAMDASVNAQGACDTTKDAVVTDLTTSFYWSHDCAASGTYTVATGGSGTASTTQACFSQCKNDQYAIIQANPGTGYQCLCASAYTPGSAADCYASGSSTWLMYTHNSAAQASGLSRRNMQAAKLRAARMAKQLCPDSLTACSIPGSTGGYECIDTSSELEACGGCAFGEFGSTNSTIGTDCTTLAGVAFGSSTCFNGQCQVFACQSGWMLAGNSCVQAKVRRTKITRPRLL